MISVREKRLGNIQQLCDKATSHLRNHEYHRAIGEYLLALELAEEWGTPQMAAALLNCLGSIYRQIEIYPRALQFYRRALALLPESDTELRPAALQQIKQVTQQVEKKRRSTTVVPTNSEGLGGLSLCVIR